jgi:catechol 2,3-dioxygenase-like lactoylglutathione lyase family enzyme
VRIHHLAIKVEDPERSLALYRDLLALPELQRWFEPDGSLRSVWLSLEGSAFLALERAHAIGGRRDDQPGHHCLALEIQKIERETWRVRLVAAGFEIERESPYTLYFHDRDRNLVALSHHPEAVAGDSTLDRS